MPELVEPIIVTAVAQYERTYKFLRTNNNNTYLLTALLVIDN